MGERILVSTLFMENSLKNNTGGAGKKLGDSGRKQLAMKGIKIGLSCRSIYLRVVFACVCACVSTRDIQSHTYTCMCRCVCV